MKDAADCIHRGRHDAAIVECEIAARLGRRFLNGYAIPFYPCNACQRQGGGSAAIAGSPPQAILDAIGSPVIHAPKGPDAVPFGPNKDAMPHPDRCDHMERRVTHVGCCGDPRRTWKCELHGTVRLADCRGCKDYSASGGVA